MENPGENLIPKHKMILTLTIEFFNPTVTEKNDKDKQMTFDSVLSMFKDKDHNNNLNS